MMDNLRAASNHVVLKIILGLIILSFVLTGVGNYLIGGNSDYAAKVNGHEISRGELEQAFNNERNRQQQMLGDQFSQLASNDGYMQQMRQRAVAADRSGAARSVHQRSAHWHQRRSGEAGYFQSAGFPDQR